MVESSEMWKIWDLLDWLKIKRKKQSSHFLFHGYYVLSWYWTRHLVFKITLYDRINLGPQTPRCIVWIMKKFRCNYLFCTTNVNTVRNGLVYRKPNARSLLHLEKLWKWQSIFVPTCLLYLCYIIPSSATQWLYFERFKRCFTVICLNLKYILRVFLLSLTVDLLFNGFTLPRIINKGSHSSKC